MSFGIILFVLTWAAIWYRYRSKIEAYWGAAREKKPKVVVEIKDRKRNKDDDESDEEEEVDPGDAYERWMAVVESKRNSIIRGSLVDEKMGPATENPLHGVQKMKGEGRAGAGTGIDDSPVVVGRLSVDNDSGFDSHYEKERDTVVMRRLSQELGSSETLEETLSSQKRNSVEGRSSMGRGSMSKIDTSGKTDRDKALLRNAMASHSTGKSRTNVLMRGSVLGGRGALPRKSSAKYTPPSPSLKQSEEEQL